MPIYTDLTPEQSDQIKVALAEALPNGPKVEFSGDEVMVRDENLYLMIRPLEYPENGYEFMEALAKAEISLRDQGIRVRLNPDVRQRMLVVASLALGGKIAVRTTDGAELQDLQREHGIRTDELEGVDLDTYAYDSEEDFAYALEEARLEHPEADFSRVMA